MVFNSLDAVKRFHQHEPLNGSFCTTKVTKVSSEQGSNLPWLSNFFCMHIAACFTHLSLIIDCETIA